MPRNASTKKKQDHSAHSSNRIDDFFDELTKDAETVDAMVIANSIRFLCKLVEETAIGMQDQHGEVMDALAELTDAIDEKTA